MITEKDRSAIAVDSLHTALVKLTLFFGDKQHSIKLLRHLADGNSDYRDDKFVQSLLQQAADFLEKEHLLQEEYDRLCRKVSHGCTDAYCPMCDGKDGAE